ncbi:DUF2059 domain-containing protein [Brevundimonas lenta]|uniref:DUF2059 domain-containing protein n=1 Tax=Brevundimonas lenta TaxID=424796 RepID=A0A7W6JEA8_9CAUL|nr:DUF2059 domain-containing protein [Brevundimonas lenta]MBB4083558.1 hypothetical protein [Brevundimonas lenta]
MRVPAVIAALSLAFATPGLAQTAPPAAPDSATRQQNLDLAGQYLELTQGSNLSKVVSQQLERSYGRSEMPADQQAWLAENMALAFDDVLGATLRDMRDDVADRFTREELQAAIAFYETPVGQSVARKDLELNMMMQEAMMPHLVRAMAALSEKFCLRFECPGSGSAAIKQF